MASNQAFIIAAYALTWVVLLGYVLHLVRGNRRTREEYRRVTIDERMWR